MHLLALILPLLLATPGFELPAQPGAVVVRLDRSGLGGGPAQAEVEILAGGTVRVAGKPAPARLTPAELQALLRFVVKDCRFFDYDDAAIDKAVEKRRGAGICGTGVTITGVTVQLKGRRATHRKLLLRSEATSYPDLAPLAHLNDIAERLRLEGRLAQAGGRKLVTGWLDRANARLKQRHPKEAPLEIEHFRRIENLPELDGAILPGADPNFGKIHGRCALFVRYEHPPGKPQRIVTATLRLDPGPPVVAVSVQG